MNPLPLPEGVAPTSKDIIACLNEYLIQILQVVNNGKDLIIQPKLSYITKQANSKESQLFYDLLPKKKFIEVGIRIKTMYFHIQELSNKEELCIQMENALEESRRNFSVAIHQQV